MRLFLIAASAVALSGCATTATPPADMPITPLGRYSLQVEPGLDRIALAVHEAGLSPTQRAALHDLARRYFASGSGAVHVQAPSANDPISSQRGWDVRAELEQAGVPASNIRLSAYDAPDPRAPVLAGFETVRAVARDCAAEPRDMGGRFSNQPSLGFGCAVTMNLAAQIADPRDILAPRAMTPADSGRAAIVFDKYRKGEPASAPQETLVEGAIARAVE